MILSLRLCGSHNHHTSSCLQSIDSISQKYLNDDAKCTQKSKGKKWQSITSLLIRLNMTLKCVCAGALLFYEKHEMNAPWLCIIKLMGYYGNFCILKYEHTTSFFHFTFHLCRFTLCARVGLCFTGEYVPWASLAFSLCSCNVMGKHVF